MLTLAARGLGKIDAAGLRGASLVSTDELTAMAGALAAFGLVPIPPGAPVPDRLIITHQGDRA
ncbi:MAG: hypothetical protein CVT82_00425 [Alphaproteobacteria bacterium HGW-Alphaproteobacteria-4]|jgi:hypothetical protein|nr:MAG: hypothetical protein CVT82_00425 [Alphaproteobacteria bacterium HGW-Alphaproteobacteria-4]